MLGVNITSDDHEVHMLYLRRLYSTLMRPAMKTTRKSEPSTMLYLYSSQPLFLYYFEISRDSIPIFIRQIQGSKPALCHHGYLLFAGKCIRTFRSSLWKYHVPFPQTKERVKLNNGCAFIGVGWIRNYISFFSKTGRCTDKRHERVESLGLSRWANG